MSDDQPQQQPINPNPGPNEPVAYDTQGRPLYLHPQQAAAAHPPQPQMVYMARPMEPKQVHISEEAMQRHRDSAKKYPHLNLSDGEFIILAIKRHPIGLLTIWAGVIITALVFTVIGVLLFAGGDSGVSSMLSANTSDFPVLVAGTLGFLYVLLGLGGLAGTYIYNQNKFYLTNESVIQEIQTSLFDKHEQTVSLSNVEDASYKQENFIQSMFNFGTIRLSTEGDETTYTFPYVASPKKNIAILNNAVEAFKNGRPVIND